MEIAKEGANTSSFSKYTPMPSNGWIINLKNGTHKKPETIEAMAPASE